MNLKDQPFASLRESEARYKSTQSHDVIARIKQVRAAQFRSLLPLALLHLLLRLLHLLHVS